MTLKKRLGITMLDLNTSVTLFFIDEYSVNVDTMKNTQVL